jgi:hypothetical protein
MVSIVIRYCVSPSGLKIAGVRKCIALRQLFLWAGVVAGRYDIIAEVVCVGGKDELYRFTTETILKMATVIRSETFIILKSRHNWIRLPASVKNI